MVETAGMDRAFSSFSIKAVDEDRREVEGWASTPSTDRQNDQLLPEGAKFELPLPFLLITITAKLSGRSIARKSARPAFASGHAFERSLSRAPQKTSWITPGNSSKTNCAPL